MDQLAQRNLGEKVLIPCNMLRSGEDVFLDDLTVEDVRQALKTEVVVVDEPGRKKKPDFYEVCWNWMGQPESMRNLQRA